VCEIIPLDAVAESLTIQGGIANSWTVSLAAAEDWRTKDKN